MSKLQASIWFVLLMTVLLDLLVFALGNRRLFGVVVGNHFYEFNLSFGLLVALLVLQVVLIGVLIKVRKA